MDDQSKYYCIELYCIYIKLYGLSILHCYAELYMHHFSFSEECHINQVQHTLYQASACLSASLSQSKLPCIKRKCQPKIESEKTDSVYHSYKPGVKSRCGRRGK